MVNAPSFVRATSGQAMSPALSLFIAVGIFFGATSAAVAQQTCRARCPNGSMSEVYNCSSNYVPLCLRASPQFVAPPPQSAPPEVPMPQASAQEVSAFVDLVDHINRVLPGFADERSVSTGSSFLSWRLLDENERLNDVIGRAETRLDGAIYERDRVQTISDEIAEVDRNVNALRAQNDNMQMYMNNAQLETRDLQEYEADQRAKARSWINYVTPKDLPKHSANEPGADQRVTLMDVPAFQKYEEPSPSTAESHSRPHPASVRLGDSYSSFEKINFIHRRLNYLSSINQQLDNLHKEYDHDWLTLQEEKLDDLRRLRGRAVFDGEQLLKQVPAVQGNFLVAAVNAFVWKTYTGHVAIADAKTFYDLNKHFYQLGSDLLSDDSVRRNVAAGKSALDVLSSRAEGIKDFLDVQKRTLDLLESTTAYIMEAPQIAATGTPEQMRSFLATLEQERKDFYWDLMQQRKEWLAPYKPFSQALMDAGNPYYQDIAKPLGLGD